MKPYEFEQLVCDHYNRMGYRATTTSLTGDYGVDVFAEKENGKIGVQAKCTADRCARSTGKQ
ncbi:MAG: restriction endonuclease [Alistipes sp.]